jgi:UDP-N-acetylglucosamine 1-carboxyvinyltransferase
MSEFLEICGATPLKGEVRVSGAKNAALPLLIASLLTAEKCRFSNVPNLKDVHLTCRLLEIFGAEVGRDNEGGLSVAVPSLLASEASYSLVKSLRASFWVLGPLLARGRAARVALPGGDIIGARPVDMHLSALTSMGADITIRHGVVFATAAAGLRPAAIDLRFPSVGATHQILMAAALTQGTTVINGAAREPEVIALANMLARMGAEIEGAGSSKIVIKGKEQLSGADISLIGDRIEAGTYLLAALSTKGEVKVTGIAPEYLGELLSIFNSMGAAVTTTADSVTVKYTQALKPVRVTTGPFPAFATDLQSPLMALLCTVSGESIIEEHVFEGRFSNVSELCRMGADISVSDHQARIRGVEALNGARVEALDIRSGAALVVAALGAVGTTTIHELDHLRRGYEDLEGKVTRIGGKVGIRLIDPEDFLFAGC